MDWSVHFPGMPEGAKVEIADIGCGFGGLIVALAQAMPETLMLGLLLPDPSSCSPLVKLMFGGVWQEWRSEHK